MLNTVSLYKKSVVKLAHIPYILLAKAIALLLTKEGRGKPLPP